MISDKQNTNSWFKRHKDAVEFIGILSLIFLFRTFFVGLYQVPSGSMEPTLLVGEHFFADKLTMVFRGPRRGEIISFNQPDYKYSKNSFVRFIERYVSIPFTNFGPQNWTKRVIGLPGETIEGKIEGGRPVIYINGVKLDEPYVNPYPLLLMYATVDVSNATGKRTPRGVALKTYDPALPFDQQPFYKIDESAIINNPLMKNYLDPNSPLPDGKDVFRYTLADDEYFVMGDNRKGSTDSRFFGPLKARDIHGRILFRYFSFDIAPDKWLLFEIIFHPIQFFQSVRWSRMFQFVS